MRNYTKEAMFYKRKVQGTVRVKEVAFLSPEKQGMAATGRRARSGVQNDALYHWEGVTLVLAPRVEHHCLGLRCSSRSIFHRQYVLCWWLLHSSAFLSKVGITNSIYLSQF